MSEVIYNKLSKIILKLKDKNIPKVQVYFDGEGDSGAIEEVIPESDGQSSEFLGEIDDELRTLIEDYAYVKICEKVNTVGDWVNNAGGYGYLYIHTDSKQVDIEYYQRATEEYDWSELDIFK